MMVNYLFQFLNATTRTNEELVRVRMKASYQRLPLQRQPKTDQLIIYKGDKANIPLGTPRFHDGNRLLVRRGGM